MTFSATIRADHTLVINSAAQAPWVNEQHTGFLDELTKEVFKRIGHDLKLVKMDANRRTLMNVDQGIDDGNLVRIRGIEKKFKNLRMVPEPMGLFDFSVFTKNPDIKIETWDDLEPYNVTFIRGWKILENNIKKAQSINMVKDATQLFELLSNDRTDLVIFGPQRGRYLLKEKNIQGIKVLPTPLATKKVYLYLNKKHEDLIPSIATTIRDMKKDGTYRKIYIKTVSAYADEKETERILAN